ncbi:helix-turn-helix domain-containing protein [Enterococcus faecalis]|uniref:helix-turn-helix domain-containing protein n=1 Tax=Enterococcus faecalis TaxID=1351 RepID=UPI0013643DA8|nr:helix-turn-helix domain-containing protein [Enterococcus faecalis]
MNKPLKSDLKKFFINIVTKSPRVQIFEAIIKGEFRSVAQFSIDYHMSVTVIREHLKEIRKVLSYYDISISNKKFEFKGKEEQIRMFLFLFYWRIFRGLHWPFKNIIELELNSLVDHLVTQGILTKPTHIEKKRILLFFAILKLRIKKKGLSITKYNSPISVTLEKHFSTNKKFIFFIKNSEEIFFISNIFKAFGWVEDSWIVREIDFEIEKKLPAGRATKYTLSKINSNLKKINECQLNRLTNYLFTIHTFANNFTNFSGDKNGYDYSKVCTRYTNNTQICIEEFIDKAKVDTKLKLYEEKRFLKLHYNMMLIYISKQNMMEKKIQICLETDLPEPVEEFLCRQISSFFRERFNFTLTNSSGIKNYNTIDILLVTIPLEEYTTIFPNAQIIAINRDLNFIDYNNIQKVLIKISKEQI